MRPLITNKLWTLHHSLSLLIGLAALAGCGTDEKPVDIELSGKISTIVADDFVNNRFSTEYVLRTAEKEYPLRFDSNQGTPPPTSGEYKVVGSANEDESIQVSKFVAAYSNESREIFRKEMVVTRPAVGVKRSAAILVNLGSHKNSVTRAQLSATMDKVGAGFRQASSGKLRVENFVVIGPIDVDVPTDKCWPTTWARAISEHPAVRHLDVDLRVAIIPYSAPCWWGGLSTKPALVRGNWPGVIFHEFGHHLGMGHAAALDSHGSFAEYGDRSDKMGSGSIGELHAPHQHFLGWNTEHDFINADESGEYALLPSGSDAGFRDAHKLVRIPPQSLTSKAYYLSYSPGTQSKHGISIHTSKKNGPDVIHETLLVRTLKAGDHFSPSSSEFSVQWVSQTDGVATVRVEFPESEEVLPEEEEEVEEREDEEKEPAENELPAITQWETSWTNPRLSGDVNNDGVVNAADLARLKNELSIVSRRRLPNPPGTEPNPSPNIRGSALYFDTNGDWILSEADALVVEELLKHK